MNAKKADSDAYAQVQNAVNTADLLKDVGRYSQLQSNLLAILRRAGLWDAEIHLYGSRIMGLGDNASDLDIYIESGNNFYRNKDVNRDRSVLERIHRALYGSSWTVKTKIMNATVPILEATFGDIKCDLSVSNGLGVKNTQMLKYMFDLRPITKELFHYVRIFLSHHPQYLGGYLLKLMVIFYFQYYGFLPSVQEIQQGLPRESLDGWEVQFDPRRSSFTALQKQLNERVGTNLLKHFLTFVKDFDYQRHVMSVYDGKAIARQYYSYPEEICCHLLCVFGPINRRHNIGKYVSNDKVQNLVRLFAKLASEL